jgi:hypothetical protein
MKMRYQNGPRLFIDECFNLLCVDITGSALNVPKNRLSTRADYHVDDFVDCIRRQYDLLARLYQSLQCHVDTYARLGHSYGFSGTNKLGDSALGSVDLCSVTWVAAR